MASAASYCQAAALVGLGQPLQVINVRIPDDLEPGALLVKTTSATVCATDVHLWEGGVASKDAGAAFPVILGHEMTGTIERFGSDSTTDSVGQPLAEGDRIIWTHGFCGQCLNCVVEHEPTLCRHRRGYMASVCTEYPYLTGGFSEYGYVFPTSGRVKVPEGLSDDSASAASCALRTVVHAFDRLGGLDDRHSVVIQGAGPLGLFALAKAVTSGPAQTVVVGGPANRLDLAIRWGATTVIDVDKTDAAGRVEAIAQLTGGRGADVVIEMSGVPQAFGEGMAMLRPGGRYVIVGQVHSTNVEFNPSTIVMKHARLIGSLSGSVSHYWRALQFMDHHKDRFRWDDMISSRYPLDRVNDAFDAMRSWREIKPAIAFN